MKAPIGELERLFERAHELQPCIQEGNARALNDLNKLVIEKELGGRMVVLETPDRQLHPGYRYRSHSLLYPAGALGGFALEHSEDLMDTPRLVASIGDSRGHFNHVPVAECTGSYDVVVEQSDSQLFRKVQAYITSDDFSFLGLAELCRQVGGDNLSLALFGAALNVFSTPSQIAARVYTLPTAVAYFSEGKDIGPNGFLLTGYSLGRDDVFALKTKLDGSSPYLFITTLTDCSAMYEFREIIVNNLIRGFDTAPERFFNLSKSNS